MPVPGKTVTLPVASAGPQVRQAVTREVAVGADARVRRRGQAAEVAVTTDM
ncbi:hypothetical protein [Streptomyces sp. BF23-19]|uniref:hypothetical protein n=1 Tax=Streptomyces TaxID=1883 RepID=UPI0034E5D00E|nr:hypothetical protein OG253_27760 [Streptomyces virginiae]